MSGPLTWKERNRDEVWCAARDRVAASTPHRPIMDYWIIDELHAEALSMVAELPPGVLSTFIMNHPVTP